MEFLEAQQKATKVLTQNGFVVKDGKVDYYESISFDKNMRVRNELSNIVFTDDKGQDFTFQLFVGETPEKLILGVIAI